MRVTYLVAGAALALMACGGEKKAAEAPAGAPAAAAGAGAVHDVDMELVGTSYQYTPNQLTIKVGDVVRFHNKSGFPHNVSFYADSIPAGAAAVLDAMMADRPGPLTGPLLVEPDAVYEINFAGAPVGEYKFFCLPHVAFGMKGKLTVQ